MPPHQSDCACCCIKFCIMKQQPHYLYPTSMYGSIHTGVGCKPSVTHTSISVSYARILVPSPRCLCGVRPWSLSSPLLVPWCSVASSSSIPTSSCTSCPLKSTSWRPSTCTWTSSTSSSTSCASCRPLERTSHHVWHGHHKCTLLNFFKPIC